MSHNDRNTSSDKQNVLSISRNHTKAKVKSCCKNISVPSSSSVCRNIQLEEKCSLSQRVKRLKTRKERDQIRGHNTSCFYQSHKQSKRGGKELAKCDCHSCHCSQPLGHCRKEKAVAKPFPPQRPTIITGGRLTSIRGLFSHEVRSLEIERLVKEQRRHSEEENNQGQATASCSPSRPSHLTLMSRSELSDHDISSFLQEDPKSKRPRSKVISVHTDLLQINSKDPSSLYRGDEKNTSAQTCCIVRSGSPSSNKQTEPEVLSLSESEQFLNSTHSTASQTDPNVAPLIEDQELTNKAKAAVCKQQQVGTPSRSLHLSLNASKPKLAPAIYNFSSSAVYRERDSLANEDQRKKPSADCLIESDTVCRLAARLCRTLDFPLLQRHRPLLKECTEVLLQTLQESHSFRLQDSLSKLHSHLSPEVPDLSHITEQPCSSFGQQYGESTPVHFSFARECEDGLQCRNMEIQADHSSVEDFHLDIDRGPAYRKRRRQSWGMYSSQDFLTKLQTPCEDMLGQWSISVPSQESLRTKHYCNPQAISLQQVFTGIEMLPLYSDSCGTLDPLILKPHNRITQASSENMNRKVRELLDQWRNDPDLDFLFQQNRRDHTTLDPTTKIQQVSKDWCPLQQMEGASKRTQFGASSTFSTFHPSEEFRYEPYYRFPPPCNSINRSQMSGIPLYNHSGMKDLDLSSTLPPYL